MAKERWASRVGLVLAMAGNAVGLGNFLRFPYQAAQNGGGAFLIPYIVSLLVLGLPLMWVEWAMGRHGGKFGHHSAPGIFQVHGRSPVWKYFGVFGLWSCLFISAFYLYIESWCLAYAGWSLINGFSGMDQAKVTEFFLNLTGEKENHIIAIGPIGMVLFFACITINVLILSKGLARGIELVAKIGMPLLIVFAALLAIRGLLLRPGEDPGVTTSPFEGLNFVWEPKFTSLDDPKVWLAAAGQIFFTLSIGMGSIHCYASYLRERDDIALTGATTAWTNEFCEVVLGGTILIPIAVAYLGLPGVQERSGFALGFFVFPTLFNNWGWLAPVAGFMWFGLLFFAAITSSLAMGQPLMSFLQQEFHVSRGRSAIMFGLMVISLALPVAMLHSNSFFDEFDYWAGTVMLVVFALTETILFVWVFGPMNAWSEINKGAEMWIPPLFHLILKYVTPVVLSIILAAYIFQPVGKVEEIDSTTGAKQIMARGWTPYVKMWFGGPAPLAWEWSGEGMIGKLMHLDIEQKIVGTKEQIEKHAAKLSDLDSELQKAPGDLGLKKSREELVKQKDVLSERIPFLNRLMMVRNIDRLVMVGMFAFLSGLVWIAWRKRAKNPGHSA